MYEKDKTVKFRKSLRTKEEPGLYKRTRLNQANW